jgi:hypothetical protein
MHCIHSHFSQAWFSLCVDRQALVAACGVRKIWSRVFENIDVSAQQIKKLKEMLTELGMTGRLSLEQAKRIKAKRELAKELGLCFFIYRYLSILMGLLCD